MASDVNGAWNKPRVLGFSPIATITVGIIQVVARWMVHADDAKKRPPRDGERVQVANLSGMCWIDLIRCSHRRAIRHTEQVAPQH
ncbi:MAG: hypothetical protein OXL68_18590 [Paracoccaceae bacterium]|nr:hypothetical protein [Paracoccaceae bacterium]